MASLRHIRRKVCGRKIAHADRAAALAALKKIKRFGMFGMMPYRCRFCRAWHVGHPSAGLRHALKEAGRL